MNKTSLIARHEFAGTVRRKAFIIFTIAFPVLALLGILASQVISGMSKPPVTKTENIAYVDMEGSFTVPTTEGDIKLVPYTSEADAKQALLNKDVKEYFVIPTDYLGTGAIRRYTLDREMEASGTPVKLIRDFLLSNLLQGNSPAVIARAQAPLNMSSTILTETGEVAPNQGGFATFIIPYIFSLLLLMSIFFSSGYLLQGLGDEKENRVMEILLSSVSPKQLLAGKVIGLGAAGLLQVVVWLFSAQFLAKYASATWGAIIGSLQVSPEFIILGTIYFILGYLLFAVLMAGVGAVSPTAREGQQMSTLFTIAGVVPLWFIGFFMQNPDHVLSQILTIFPITAPITIMIRLGLTHIPIWEIAASILVMVLTIIGLFILAAKLFRTYLLMYGKRPSIKDIMKSFRNA